MSILAHGNGRTAGSGVRLLLPAARGRGLSRFLLHAELEVRHEIAREFHEISEGPISRRIGTFPTQDLTPEALDSVPHHRANDDDAGKGLLRDFGLLDEPEEPQHLALLPLVLLDADDRLHQRRLHRLVEGRELRGFHCLAHGGLLLRLLLLCG